MDCDNALSTKYTSKPKRFGIDHFRTKHLKGAHQYMSYTVDNENHVLYWLEIESIATEIINHCSLIALDITDLKNIKLTNQTLMSCQEYPWLKSGHYQMLIVGNTIQFISSQLGRTYPGPMCLHFEFSIKTQKLKLICENVALTRVNSVTKSNMSHLLKHFQIGDWIDVRNFRGKFYLARILDIYEHADTMAIRINYRGWPDIYNEWIHESEMSLCDCTHKCRFWDIGIYQNSKDHRIALPRSHSMYGINQRLDGFHAFYSDNYQRMVLFGSSNIYSPDIPPKPVYSCVYYKNNDKYKERKYKMIVSGFIRQQFETKWNLLVPYDLYNLIFKYYFIPDIDDKMWHQLIDKDQHDKFVGDKYHDVFSYSSGFVLINDGKVIVIFSSTDTGIFKLNVNTMEMRRLISIDTSCLNSTWGCHAVVCRKSKNVHLFTSSFEHHVRISVAELNTAPSVPVK